MRAREFVRETAVGHILTPRFEIVVDDHALERARERGVDPQAVDYIIRTQLPKVSRKLDQIEVNQKFWVYDWSRELALGLRRLSSTEPRFLLKTVWPGRPARTPEAEQIVSINESVGADQVIIYANHKGATIDDSIKNSLPVTNVPVDKLQLWEKHKSMQDPKVADWVNDKLLPELKQNGKLKPLLVWNNHGKLFVIDGNHRLIAYQEAGFQGRVPVQIVPDNMIAVSQKVAEGKENNGISFQVQKGKNKFATTLSIGSDPVGVYQYDADTGRSIAEVYPEFKGKGLGKLLVLHAIYTAAKLGLDFQEDESRTSEYDNVLDSLSSNGYIVDDEGYWYVTGEGEQFLKQSLKQGVAENMSHDKDGRAVEELKSALLAKRDQLQSATDDQVYDIIDKIMTRIARSHSISGQKLHDMWVDKYRQIPDTWIMNEKQGVAAAVKNIPVSKTINEIAISGSQLPGKWISNTDYNKVYEFGTGKNNYRAQFQIDNAYNYDDDDDDEVADGKSMFAFFQAQLPNGTWTDNITNINEPDTLKIYSTMAGLIQQILKSHPEISSVSLFGRERVNNIYQKLLQRNITKVLPGWQVTSQGIERLEPTMAENFADGKGPGRPGDSQRHGIPKKATMAELEKAAHAKGRKGQLARWQLNMRRGKKK